MRTGNVKRKRSPPTRKPMPATLDKRRDAIIPGHTLYAYNMVFMRRCEGGRWNLYWGHTWGCQYTEETLPKPIKYYLAKHGRTLYMPDRDNLVVQLSKEDFEDLARSDGYAFRREDVPDSRIENNRVFHGQ